MNKGKNGKKTKQALLALHIIPTLILYNLMQDTRCRLIIGKVNVDLKLKVFLIFNQATIFPLTFTKDF